MSSFTLNSNQHDTASGLKDLFAFLTDFKNFDSILPHDKIEDFKVLEDGCSFLIKGITPMTIKLKTKTPFSHIHFSSEGLAKFNFDLHVYFNGEPSLPGTCRIELAGNLNPFIKSMAEKPLTTLIDTMSLKLSALKIT